MKDEKVKKTKKKKRRKYRKTFDRWVSICAVAGAMVMFYQNLDIKAELRQSQDYNASTQITIGKFIGRMDEKNNADARVIMKDFTEELKTALAKIGLDVNGNKIKEGE